LDFKKKGSGKTSSKRPRKDLPTKKKLKNTHPKSLAFKKKNPKPLSSKKKKRLVAIHGEGHWSALAALFPGRVGKQCRERWHNQLRPDIKKTAWSQREEAALVRAHARCGNRWVELARALPGRAENNVKNHWSATLRCKDSGVGDRERKVRVRW
jgi:myb proto-oncogene protein